jgi:hypothetical protein
MKKGAPKNHSVRGTKKITQVSGAKISLMQWYDNITQWYKKSLSGTKKI